MTCRSMAAVAVAAAIALTGCGSGGLSAGLVRSELGRQLPQVHFERDSHIRLGRVALAFARGVLRFAGEDEETRSLVSHVRRLEITSWTVDGLEDASAVRLPEPARRRLAEHNWVPLVKTREEDGVVWIFTRTGSGGSIDRLCVVDFDASELLVVELAGRLDRLTAEAIADDPRGFADDVGG